MSLLIDETIVKRETIEHIYEVRKLLGVIAELLVLRGALHDRSKLDPEEFLTFAKYTPRLRGSIYGSDEYKQCLNEMGPALAHHYKYNRHHPEHFVDGVDGMNLVDVVEMIVDWKAATLRHETGDMNKSVELNAGRFQIGEQLLRIIRNTVRDLGLQEQKS